MTDFAVFTHDIYRVRIVQEEAWRHPWAVCSQASQLLCWDEDACFGTDDMEKEHRPLKESDITPEVAAQFYDYLVSTKRPFVFIGLQADKYGFIAVQSSAIGYSGSLVITEEMYKRFIDDSPKSDEDMFKDMSKRIYYEFEMLKSYLGGQVYGYITEVDNTHKQVLEPGIYGELKPFESGIDILDSCSAYLCLNENYTEMYNQMIEDMKDISIPSILEISKQMLASAQGVKVFYNT